jgi:amino acid permease
LFGTEPSQVSTQQRPLLRASPLDSYISTHFTTSPDLIQRFIWSFFLFVVFLLFVLTRSQNNSKI